MGVILAAADALNWLAKILQTPAETLVAELGEELLPPTGLVFAPYLGGERTPHNSAKLRGGFVGLAHEHDRGAMVRAVLEGVAFAFRDNQQALQAAGTEIDSLFAVGGGAQSQLWLKILATVLRQSLLIPENGEYGGASGAARMAIMADGGSIDAICTRPKVAQEIVPESTLLSAFDAAYQRYQALLPAL